MQGIFQTILLCVLTALCFLSAYELAASFPKWGTAGALLLFLGLLTLINAPFDWASLGLTRALLRVGLERGGWWPLLLALIDAVCAALIVALLTIAMVLGIQAFNSLAVLGGGTAILSLERLLAGIGNRETAQEPEFWWVYVLLLSTLVPSLINLGIGGASLMRGLPFLPSVLLRFLPEDSPVPSAERVWIPLVLALQTVGGVILGLAVQALIFWGVIVHVMPWFGFGLLDMARDLVAFDLPAKAWHLLGLIR